MLRLPPCLSAALAVLALLILAPAARAGTDLVVTQIIAVPTAVVAGQNVRFDVTVKNQGASATSTAWLGVQINVNNAYATWGGQNATLAPGASITIRTEPWLATASSFTVSALADYPNYFAEDNESNNRLTVAYPTPADLVITSFTPVTSTLTPGTPVRFDVTVKNQGASATAANWLGVKIDAAGTYATWGGKNATLAPGASTVIRTEPWTVSATPYPLLATADYPDYYPETNETNNTFTLQAPPAAGVDLVTTDVRVIRPDVVAGDLVSFEVTVKNQGGTALASTWFGVAVEVNGAFAAWGGGTYALAPGASVKIRTDGWTATSGNFQMTGEADFSNTVAESAEANNRLTFAYASPAPVYQTTPATGGWNPVWSDEFTGTGVPDPAKWTQEQGFIRNEESQYYTVNRAQNLRREDGVLIIEAHREDYPVAGLPNSYGATVAPYTSGSLITKGKASWTYGRIDVAVKVATARGTWSCIWTLGDNIGTVGWPRCGEIDLMESVGWESAITHHSIHTQARSHYTGNGYSAPTRVPALATSFIVYSIEWDAQRIRFFADGRRVAEYANDGTGEASWPFFRNQHLLLNLAVGGTWGRVEGIDEAAFPQRMSIDYVRVYQK
jgi:beta-glucanase (GH16 family)